MLNKNEIYKMKVEDLSHDGFAVGTIDNIKVFVEGGLYDEVLEVKIVKAKTSFCFGKLIKIIKPSKERITPPCPVYTNCGGCHLQHMNYDLSLKFKQKKIEDSLKRLGGLTPNVLPIVSPSEPINYRNKAIFVFSYEDEKVCCGFYKKRTHEVVKLDECLIQDKQFANVAKLVLEFANENKVPVYDEINHKGVLRNLLIKSAHNTNELMVCLVINAENLAHSDKLIAKLSEMKEITSVSLNINKKRGNSGLSEKIKVLAGKPYITELIGDIAFRISPLSFFQVNPVGTFHLYSAILKLAKLNKESVVYDLYCGVGSITLFLAKHCKEIIGVEIAEDAIKDALINAEENAIENATFLLGDVSTVLNAEELTPPDVIVVDPPRKGLSNETIETILTISPNKIIYVSCDAATLARDLKIFVNGGYTVDVVEPFDMFPMTYHVECVVSLSKAGL